MFAMEFLCLEKRNIFFQFVDFNKTFKFSGIFPALNPSKGSFFDSDP
jgi:hypothetical protein